MKRVLEARVALLVLVLALVAAACGGGDSEPEGAAGGEDATTDESTDGAATEAGSDAAAAGGGGEFSVYIGEPENISPPANVTETNGGEVLNAIHAPLIEYDLEAGVALTGDEAPDAIAESIESDDQQTWTVTLKDGWTFHDGSPVTAQSFVDGWNYGAFGSNAFTGAYFFEKIAGYEDLQCEADEETGECASEPAATEMSGLEVVDDLTFTVELTEPFSIWPLVMGYTAFYPVPEGFVDDPEAQVEQPVGTGPYMMEEPWAHNEAINVVRYEDYAGGSPGNADAIEFRIYAEPDTAYNDLLAGNLDIMDVIPAAQLESAETEFGPDRIIRQPGGSYQFLGFPTYDERFADPNLRKAFSMAIDRQAIVDAIRPDFTPATGFVNPQVAGALDDSCGGNCEFNVEEAQRLLEEAGGFEGTLTLWFNSGGDHEGWIEATANQLTQNLGIEAVEFETLDFAEYLPLAQEEGFTGPYRLGWVPDYPSPETYLTPLHASGASSNYTGYASEEFDAAIAEGNQAEDPEASIPFYEDAQGILAEDMPHIPMFFAETTGVWSERVDGVEISFFDDINVAEITVSEG